MRNCIGLSVTFKIKLNRPQAMLAIGFVSRREFVVVVWPFTLEIGCVC